MSGGLLLAIDTTADFGSIALLRGSVVIEEVPLHAPDGFGQVIFAQIDALLQRHGFHVKDIDCFASASGPGSFTGVRIGLAAAKGLAESTGKPAVGVSNLRAIAAYGEGPLRAAVIDARRGEIYGAVYDADLQPVREETVMVYPQWLAGLPAGAEVVSQNPALFAGRAAPRALAAAIGRIAAGEAWVDPAALDANYVRRSDAELMWREA